MPKPAPPGYRELNDGEPTPRDHWFYDYRKQGTPFVHCDKPDELGQGVGDPYDPENHAAGRYVKLPDFEAAVSKQIGITEEKENTMQQTCRCRDAVDEPVPEGYRELEDGERIQEGDVKFDDPGKENYYLIKANGAGNTYQPHGSHNHGRFRKISQSNVQSNQGEIMSNKLFETRHLVNGRNIADVSAEELYGLITQRENQIKNLQEAKHQPAKLKKYIAELEQELVDLVKFVDENDAKAEPTAPAAE